MTSPGKGNLKRRSFLHMSMSDVTLVRPRYCTMLKNRLISSGFTSFHGVFAPCARFLAAYLLVLEHRVCMTRGVKNSLKMSRGLYDFWKSSCGPGVLLGQNGNCGGHTSSSAPSCHLSTSGAGVLLFDVGALFLMAVFTRLGTGGGHEGPGRSEATSSAGSDGVGVVFFLAVLARISVSLRHRYRGGHHGPGR